MLIEKELFIPKRIPSENDFKGRHWQTYYRKYRQSWERDLGYMLGQGQHNNLPRMVRLTAYQKNKQSFYDRGNLIGGAKPVLDAIKSLGWIKDDSEDWVYDVYRQRMIGQDGVKEVGTLIELFEQTADVIFEDSPELRLCKDCFLRLQSQVREVPLAGTVLDPGECRVCGAPGAVGYRLQIWEVASGGGK